MNLSRYFCIFSILLFIAASVHADDYIGLVKKGNKAYSAADYQTALDNYQSAEKDLPESPELDYDIAGALYQQGDYDKAIEKYKKALETKDLDLEAQAHYNLGNTYFKKQDYQNAITSYQNALTINPEDLDAKFNLELARKMLKEQMKPQQQNQDQQQQQDQKKKDQKQQNQQDQKDKQQQGKNGDQQKQQQDQGGKNDKDKKQQEQQAQQQKMEGKKMSKEDAERILNALKDAEQKIQATIRRQNQTDSDYNGKDW